MKNQVGITLIQTAVAVGIVGAMVVIAVPGYHAYMAKAQVSEVNTLLSNSQVNAITALQKGQCPTGTIKGKFGVVEATGTFIPSNGASCPSGCELTYTFNSNGVIEDLNNKVASVALLNNGKISAQEAKTTVPSRYLTGLTVSAASIAGDNCAASQNNEGYKFG